MSDVGNRIKSLRKNRHMSQKEFAEGVFITQSYLSRIEQGKEEPTDMLLKLISYEFNCSWIWLKKGDLSELGEANSINTYSNKEYNESLKLDAIQACSYILNYLIKKKCDHPNIYENIYLSLETIIHCLKLEKKNMDEISLNGFVNICTLFMSTLDDSIHNVQSHELMDETYKNIKETFDELEDACRVFATETLNNE